MPHHLFDRKTDSFFGPLRYLGYVLLLVGAGVAGSPWWRGSEADKGQAWAVGGLLMLLGILFRFTFHGFQLDFQKRRVREYLSMFGLKTGKWAPLPAFNRVVLTSHLRAADDHGHDHGHSHEEKPAPPVLWYTLGLYSQSEEADYEFRTDNAEDAHKTLHLLATRLGIVAENHTTSPASHQ
ncbi:hypothetical protein ACD591_00040 [Rufibacter glacialis]|uniref:Uncharacterized protein n=1 Tax=Rufibacter glacialis TaxID=1259555 RepID=A0A5M8QJY2_9BACT|nr:hypothetical protein [Rufibacter glacialis]KAA6435304.1 hypothetical protein FOE74_04955 [Rufibacter glacialis]GGK62172.1 hypothetical protein GCM10011405_07870 [Rufibacter glacialis]